MVCYVVAWLAAVVVMGSGLGMLTEFGLERQPLHTPYFLWIRAPSWPRLIGSLGVASSQGLKSKA